MVQAYQSTYKSKKPALGGFAGWSCNGSHSKNGGTRLDTVWYREIRRDVLVTTSWILNTSWRTEPDRSTLYVQPSSTMQLLTVSLIIVLVWTMIFSFHSGILKKKRKFPTIVSQFVGSEFRVVTQEVFRRFKVQISPVSTVSRCDRNAIPSYWQWFYVSTSSQKHFPSILIMCLTINKPE